MALKLNKIKAGTHSMALSSQGTLIVWGRCSLGFFKIPESITTIPNALEDISVGVNLSSGLDDKGNVWMIDQFDKNT